MEIIIHTNIKKFDTDYKKAFGEYAKRTSPYCKLTIKNYKTISQISLRKSSKKLILNSGKETISSPDLAKLIQDYNLNGFSTIEIIIPSSNEACNFNFDYDILQLSSFNISTELSIVVLSEQIYRAYTILNNITYHK